MASNDVGVIPSQVEALEMYAAQRGYTGQQQQPAAQEQHPVQEQGKQHRQQPKQQQQQQQQQEDSPQQDDVVIPSQVEAYGECSACRLPEEEEEAAEEDANYASLMEESHDETADDLAVPPDAANFSGRVLFSGSPVNYAPARRNVGPEALLSAQGSSNLPPLRTSPSPNVVLLSDTNAPRAASASPDILPTHPTDDVTSFFALIERGLPLASIDLPANTSPVTCSGRTPLVTNPAVPSTAGIGTSARTTSSISSAAPASPVMVTQFHSPSPLPSNTVQDEYSAVCKTQPVQVSTRSPTTGKASSDGFSAAAQSVKTNKRSSSDSSTRAGSLLPSPVANRASTPAEGQSPRQATQSLAAAAGHDSSSPTMQSTRSTASSPEAAAAAACASYGSSEEEDRTSSQGGNAMIAQGSEGQTQMEKTAKLFQEFLESMEVLDGGDKISACYFARLCRVLNIYPKVPRGMKCALWEAKGHLPAKATGCCYLPCVHDGYLYAAITFSYLSNNAMLFKVPLGNLSRNAWKPVDLPDKSSDVRWYSHCYFFSYDNHLYFVGRPDVRNAPPFSVWRLFTESQSEGHISWEQVNVFPELTKGWQDFGIVVHRDRLFICSGKRGWSGEGSMMALPLNRAETDWETTWPALPAEFFSPSLAVYKGKIRITGSENHKDVYTLYDDLPQSKRRWVKDDLKPTPHYRSAMACVNGSLVTVGGYESSLMRSQYQTHAYVYRETAGSKGKWLPLPDLSVPRRRPYLLSTDHMMLVLSGWRGSFVEEVETIGFP